LLQRAALLLLVWSLASYAYGIANVGGFVAAYSRAKGGGYAPSGYLSEGMNLSLAACAMAGLSRYRRGWTAEILALLALGLLPNLLQGTFGGRRGPLFLALVAAVVSCILVRRKPVRLLVLWPSLAAAALAVLFVQSQRQFVYLGSGQSIRWEDFGAALAEERVNQGQNFIYGAGFVLATRRAEEFTWGRKLAVNLLVRPVPRQLWPTKYEDVGAVWVTSNYPGLGHLSRSDWIGSVGWLPLAGSSAISVADLYGEFSWGAVIILYFIGRAFAALNNRRRARGGMWVLLYVEALILSIYLATQSFSAFYHRYLILAIPTVVAWKYFVSRGRKRQTRSLRVRYVSTQPASIAG
jgi:hypothetical protein